MTAFASIDSCSWSSRHCFLNQLIRRGDAWVSKSIRRWWLWLTLKLQLFSVELEKCLSPNSPRNCCSIWFFSSPGFGEFSGLSVPENRIPVFSSRVCRRCFLLPAHGSPFWIEDLIENEQLQAGLNWNAEKFSSLRLCLLYGGCFLSLHGLSWCGRHLDVGNGAGISGSIPVVVVFLDANCSE